MVTLTLILSIALALQAQPAPANPCGNGSFEELAANGFPVDWGPLGTAAISADAHSGKRSLRLVRTTEPPAHETGVNGRNIDRLKGGMSFHYKAIAAKDARLHIYAIPIAVDGVEKTAAPRARFVVPQEHVGDGRWHQGRLKYDFSKSPTVKSVIFAARLEGSAGELLMDDISYMEQVGPVLRLGSIRLAEDPQQPGQRCTVATSIENAGDVPALGVRVVMEVPTGLNATPLEIPIGDLPPDVRRPTVCTLNGERTQRGRLRFSATAGSEQVSASLELAPKLEIKSFGPTSPVAGAGQPAVIECALTNTGTAFVLDPNAEFTLGGNKAEARAERCAPGSSLVLRASFRPEVQGLQMPATVVCVMPRRSSSWPITITAIPGGRSPRRSSTVPCTSRTQRARTSRSGRTTSALLTPQNVPGSSLRK